jgi:hypothetical protein
MTERREKDAMDAERDYFEEAQAILHRDIECFLLPERAHLEALDSHYQELLCKIAVKLTTLRDTEVLNG